MKDWPIARVAPKVAEAVENDYSDHVMVCLRPDLDLRDTYASMNVTSEDVDDLHITLWYGGTVDDLGGEQGRERLMRACYGTALDWGAQSRPKIKGLVNGFGWFLNDDANVLVALWDLPYLGSLREALLANLALHGVPMRTEDHGFTPHMTLAYEDDRDNVAIPTQPTGGRAEQTFNSLWLVWGEDWQEIPLV